MLRAPCTLEPPLFPYPIKSHKKIKPLHLSMDKTHKCSSIFLAVSSPGKAIRFHRVHRNPLIFHMHTNAFYIIYFHLLLKQVGHRPSIFLLTAVFLILIHLRFAFLSRLLFALCMGWRATRENVSFLIVFLSQLFITWCDLGYGRTDVGPVGLVCIQLMETNTCLLHIHIKQMQTASDNKFHNTH
jgi:hypothetical protein